MREAVVDLRFAPYKPGEEQQILDLFSRVFGWELPLSFWRWRQSENPAGGPWTEMVWDGDTLAGHYAVSASKLCVNGEAVPACLSMTTMVHQDYRGQGIFERSAEAIYERLTSAGIKAVYGFPNNNSHRPFVQKVGWQDIYEIPTLALNVATARKKGSEAVEVEEFDARFDRLWKRVKDRHAIWDWRDAETLSWRFTRNPINKYRVAVVQDIDDIRGYVVTKRYLDKGLDIVDMVVEDAAAAGDLVAWATAEAEKLHLPSVNMWAPTDTQIRQRIEVDGFVPVAPVTYFGGRVFSDIGVDFHDRRLWNYSMSSSDLY